MIFDFPRSLTGWSLLVLSIRLIRIDGHKLDKYLRKPVVKYNITAFRSRETYPRSRQSSATDEDDKLSTTSFIGILLRLLLSFAALYLAFPTTISGVGGIVLGSLLLEPTIYTRTRRRYREHPRARDYEILAGEHHSQTAISTYKCRSSSEMVLARSKKSIRRLSQDLKRALGKVDDDQSDNYNPENLQTVIRAPFRHPADKTSTRSTQHDGVNLPRKSSSSCGRGSNCSLPTDTSFESSLETSVPDVSTIPPRPHSRLSHHAPVSNFSSSFPPPSSSAEVEELSPLYPSPLFSPTPPPRTCSTRPTARPPTTHIPLELIELRVDDWIQLADGREGIIRFLGSRAGTATEWIGIEVIPNIAVNGAMYADWGPQANVPALWVRPSGVLRILHRPMPMDIFEKGLWDGDDGFGEGPEILVMDDGERERERERDVDMDMEREIGGVRESSWERRSSVQTLWTLGTISEDEEEEDEAEDGAAADAQAEQDHEEIETDTDMDDADTVADERSPITDPSLYAETESGTFVDESPGCEDGFRRPFSFMPRDSSGNVIFEFDEDSFSRTTSQLNQDEQEDGQEDNLLGDLGDTDEFETRIQDLVKGLDDIFSGMDGLGEFEGRQTAEHEFEVQYECVDVPKHVDRRWSAPHPLNVVDAAEAPVVREFKSRSESPAFTPGPGLERSFSKGVRRRWKEWTGSPGAARRHIGWASASGATDTA